MAEMLIDGAKLDACNTAEADAIRAKTGGSADIPYDYANNKGFADAIAAIETGGVGVEFEWATSAEVVTIGANTVTNAEAAKAFFNSYDYDFVLIVSELSANNQVVGFAIKQNGSFYRYRNGVIASAAIYSSYDAVLVEGSKYLLLKK